MDIKSEVDEHVEHIEYVGQNLKFVNWSEIPESIRLQLCIDALYNDKRLHEERKMWFTKINKDLRVIHDFSFFSMKNTKHVENTNTSLLFICQATVATTATQSTINPDILLILSEVDNDDGSNVLGPFEPSQFEPNEKNHASEIIAIFCDAHNKPLQFDDLNNLVIEPLIECAKTRKEQTDEKQDISLEHEIKNIVSVPFEEIIEAFDIAKKSYDLFAQQKFSQRGFKKPLEKSENIDQCEFANEFVNDFVLWEANDPELQAIRRQNFVTRSGFVISNHFGHTINAHYQKVRNIYAK